MCRMGSTELAQPECIARAGRRGAFSRSLRADIKAGDVDLLFAMACEHARMGQTNGGAPKAPAIADDERD